MWVVELGGDHLREIFTKGAKFAHQETVGTEGQAMESPFRIFYI
jgi:hypothetical protein